MTPDSFEWQSGAVAFWDLTFLDATRPLPSQVEDLKEDLAQIRYGDVILDIGWSPSFSESGAFVVRVVRESDWEAPLFFERHSAITDMIAAVRRAVPIAAAAKAPRSR
jgi:hypothetical protein